MNKKILLAAILLTLLSYDSKANKASHAGFYIGTNLGYTSVNGNLNHDPLIRYSIKSINNDMGGHSFIPNISFFLGYGWVHSITNIYLGFEIFRQDGNIKASMKNEIYNHDIIFNTNISAGGTTKIGYLYNNVLFILKSGIVYTGTTNKDSLLYLKDRWGIESSGNKCKTWEKGFIIGIGIDYSINNKYSIGLESIYEIYSPIKIYEPYYGTISYKPVKFTSNIRLKYNF